MKGLKPEKLLLRQEYTNCRRAKKFGLGIAPYKSDFQSGIGVGPLVLPVMYAAWYKVEPTVEIQNVSINTGS